MHCAPQEARGRGCSRAAARGWKQILPRAIHAPAFPGLAQCSVSVHKGPGAHSRVSIPCVGAELLGHRRRIICVAWGGAYLVRIGGRKLQITISNQLFGVCATRAVWA
jgi:hypothetical protein